MGPGTVELAWHEKNRGEPITGAGIDIETAENPWRQDWQSMEQEMALAAQIQASLLPRSLPARPGWQMSATLKPARLASGDFFDVIPLTNGRLGIVIADVAGKGTGAALYMALSRTLIRTFAIMQPRRPDLALAAANRRILEDTRADLFVTVFLAVLDPRTGRLSYANAGHNPPILFRHGADPEGLGGTGLPLGLFRGEPWQYEQRELSPGDWLLLYTDGITEAHNADERMFGTDGLLQVARAVGRYSADRIKTAILNAVTAHMREEVQFDDIALMIVKRES